MLLATAVAELQPSLSPDERFMAYVSDDSGRREVYIRALSGAARRVQVSSERGDEPVWSPQGSELFYRRGAQMIAVPVSTASGVTLGKAAVLFEGRYDVDPFNSRRHQLRRYPGRTAVRHGSSGGRCRAFSCS